jgi:Flp pilus assembly protein TadG
MTRHDQEGSAVLEVVLLAPVLLLILAAVVGGARVTLAHQRVDAAAAQAARAASAATSPSAATTLARSAARSAASNGGLDCINMAVTVDVSSFRPGGSVTVRVSCTADLGAGVPGLSGRRTVRGSRSEVIDTYAQVTG